MKKEKNLYSAPASRVLDLNLEGAFCASGNPLEDPMDLPGFEDGGEL